VHRVYQALTQGGNRRAPNVKRTGCPAGVCLAIEGLEERMLLSTLTEFNGVLDYGPSTSVASTLDYSA
jgi:hypothetical protein